MRRRASLRELRDRREIEELIHAYCRHFDQNEPELVAALFTEEAVVDYGPGFPNIVGAASIAGSIAVGLEQTFEATSHHVSNIQITFDGPDRATGLTYLYAWHRYRDGSPDGELWGRYHHRFKRTPGGWRIAELVLTAAGSGTSTARRCTRPAGAERSVARLDERDVEVVGVAERRVAPLAAPDVERHRVARLDSQLAQLRRCRARGS